MVARLTLLLPALLDVIVGFKVNVIGLVERGVIVEQVGNERNVQLVHAFHNILCSVRKIQLLLV